jgi:tetratricopeptide (TPR) repeat protein
MLILLAASLCAAAQSPLERAVTVARERRYAEARKSLEGVAEPAGAAQRIAFHRLKAAIASGLGEAANAAGEMRSALELAPNDAGLLLATAVAESEAGRLDDALAHARAAGNTAAAQALIGDIREKRGEYVEAAKAYQAAVALAPGEERYRIALALELVQHHTFDPAIAVLQQSAPLFPKSARIRTLLGIAQYANGNLDEAIASLTDAVLLDPALEPAYAYLARVTRESPAAPPERALKAICSRAGTVCSAMKLRVARERQDAGLLNEATAELKRARPDDPVARCELGRAYQWSEQWTEARAQMQECVRLDPSPQNHYRLGVIYTHLGLAGPAQRQMQLWKETSERMSAEVARRESAVQAFQYVMK